jgi:hypothetical protein
MYKFFTKTTYLILKFDKEHELFESINKYYTL